MKIQGSRFRQTLFWIHLACGLITGVVVAIMSATGIAIAFEEEILHWVDREVSHVDVPVGAQRMSVAELHAIVQQERPEFPVRTVQIPSSHDAAYSFMQNFHSGVYVNPYTGEIAESNAEGAHEIIHTLEMWHRFLAFHGDDNYIIGRMINGVSNIAFLMLCLTGLYLWFPRKWSGRALKAILLFKRGAKGKARDYNWHNVIGFWSLPILILLVVTAVPISFEWGHKLVFNLAGEEAPKSRNFGMMAVPPAEVPTPVEGAVRLGYEEVIEQTQAAYPEWLKIGVPLHHASDEDAELAPTKLDVFVPDYMPSRGWIPVEVDPYTGNILQAVRLQDRSAGLQARVWVRFLHTGGAFGFWGKVIASIACLGALFLVYTGFALSYRRFFIKRSKK